MAHWGIAYAAGPNYNKQWEAFDPGRSGSQAVADGVRRDAGRRCALADGARPSSGR